MKKRMFDDEDESEFNLNDENSYYIGDGAYAHRDKYGRLWVVTWNGIRITNTVCLENDVFESLTRFYNNRILKSEAKDEG